MNRFTITDYDVATLIMLSLALHQLIDYEDTKRILDDTLEHLEELQAKLEQLLIELDKQSLLYQPPTKAMI